ncbi:MAG: hypothetical protein M8467_18795, partial [Anaerolineae bacterium]|nr:hypothetical protein [Anaerolineae bacterium]
MNAGFCEYNHERDFLRVRDFLIETFSLTEQPLNWRLERWNYARYFITPLLATDGVGEPDTGAYEAAIHRRLAERGKRHR